MNQIQIVEIPCGTGGLNYAQSITEYPVEDLRQAESITIEDDTWQKEGGATKINTTVITDAPSILGLWDFWPSASTQKRIAATSDGKLVSVGTSGIIDTLATGLGTNKLTVFAESLGGSSTRKLFSFNGYDSPRVTSDGVTAAAISTPPADWTGTTQPPAGVAHNGRMWAWLNHTVYYSTLGNHEDFTGSGSGTLNVFPGEGEKIVAGWSFAGRLYLIKFPRGIYWVDDSSTTASEWKCKRLTRAIGMAGPLGLSQIDNDVVLVSTDGLIHALSTVESYGDAKASAILPEKIGPYLRDNMAFNRLAWASAIYYPSKKIWMLACSQSGATTNNLRVMLDLHDMANPKYSYSTRDVCQSLAPTRDSNSIDRPMFGDNAGFIRYLDSSSCNKDGSGYTAKFETADVELVQSGSLRANLQYLEVIFRPQGEYNLTVEVYHDGVPKQTILFSMEGIGGAALGTFVLDTDVLAGGNVLNTRKKIYGDCRRIRLLGYNSGINETFSIAKFLVGISVGTDRVSA